MFSDSYATGKMSNNTDNQLDAMRIINKSLSLHLVGCLLFFSKVHGQINLKFGKKFFKN
jgi:hypothetical protein